MCKRYNMDYSGPSYRIDVETTSCVYWDRNNSIWSTQTKLDLCFKKESLAQVFYNKFCEISKNTFLTEHLRTNASDIYVFFNHQPIYK